MFAHPPVWEGGGCLTEERARLGIGVGSAAWGGGRTHSLCGRRGGAALIERDCVCERGRCRDCVCESRVVSGETESGGQWCGGLSKKEGVGCGGRGGRAVY